MAIVVRLVSNGDLVEVVLKCDDRPLLDVLREDLRMPGILNSSYIVRAAHSQPPP